MVEHLGSGVPRTYSSTRKPAMFLSNFTRVVFPYAEGFGTPPQATPQATGQVEERFISLLEYCLEPRSTAEMMQYVALKDRKSFREVWLVPLLEAGLLTMTLPDKLSSPKQKYQTLPVAVSEG